MVGPHESVLGLDVNMDAVDKVDSRGIEAWSNCETGRGGQQEGMHRRGGGSGERKEEGREGEEGGEGREIGG